MVARRKGQTHWTRGSEYTSRPPYEHPFPKGGVVYLKYNPRQYRQRLQLRGVQGDTSEDTEKSLRQVPPSLVPLVGRFCISSV